MILSFYLIIRPFENNITMYMETFNEINIIVCYYFSYLFTDFIDNLGLRYNIGWAFLIVIAIAFAVNFILLLAQIIIVLYCAIKQKL
jgi:hypothetical protein